MKEYLVLLLAGILLFGCAGGENTSAKAVNAGTDKTGTDNTGVETGDKSGQRIDKQDEKIEDKGFADLISLDVPVRCDVNQVGPQGEVLATLYLKGEKFRMEMSGEVEGENYESTVIYNDDTYYISIEGKYKSQMNNCDWLKFELDEPTSQTDSFSLDDLKNLPSDKYSCAPAVFGDEKFNVDGKACTMNEAIVISP